MVDITKVPEIKITYSHKVPIDERIRISESKDIAELMHAWWDKYMPDTKGYVESFTVAMLNRNNQVLGARCIGYGGISAVHVDKAVVLQHAIKSNADKVILCHNHPSGNSKPSEADIAITVDIRDALKLVNIGLLDHIIITPDPKVYHSFCDNGPGV